MALPDTLPGAVEVDAPATVANLGPGFDILGMALEAPFDTIRAERTDDGRVVIVAISGDEGRLPLDPARNTAGIAALETLKRAGFAGKNVGIRLTITKGLPLASGLGSSAASAAGAAVAVNTLLGEPLTREGLIAPCVEAEATVSGRHADNVAPALLGGIVLITGLEAKDIYRLPTPDNLWLALVTPAVAVPTAKARAVLPKSVSLHDHVTQTANVALLLTAIHRGDVPLMGAAMEHDIIIEPAREHLMPGLPEVRAAAREAGAFGTIISGAGPTLCSVCGTQQTANRVAEAALGVYGRLGLGAQVVVTQPASGGVKVKISE